MPVPVKSAPDLTSIFRSLRTLLEKLERPAPPHSKRPGRPAKNRAGTSPVILHLYTSQIRWLDDYAAMIESLRPDNRRLSRVEIIRGLLLGLGQHALEHQLPFPDVPIHCERDLQHAIAQTLREHA